jgi:RNA polymerase sigma factor (sigma-70 family)
MVAKYVYLGKDPFVLKYQGLVLSIVARYSTSANDYEDLVSAGMLGLMIAKKTFKKSKGCQMSTWVFTCARSEIQKAKNSELIIKISPATAINKKIELSNLDGVKEKYTEENPYTMLAEYEECSERQKLYKDLWMHLNKKFCLRDRNIVLDYYIHGKSIRYIDKKYHTNCYKVIAQVKSYLRNLYGISVGSSSSSSSIS